AAQIARDMGDRDQVIQYLQHIEPRHNEYPDGRTVGVSSSTLGNVETYVHPETGLEHWKVADGSQVSSPIWMLWQQGSRHEWAWPCPDCREYFIPRHKLLWWPEDTDDLETIEREARLVCPRCGSQIGSEHKAQLNARGRFVAPGQSVTPDGDILDTGGAAHTGARYVLEGSEFTYWVSGLCNFSVKATFGALAVRWFRAVQSGEDERVQGVLNTVFGELFGIGGDAPKAEAVKERCAGYLSGAVPDDVNLLTCFVDVQKRFLTYVVRGWGLKYRSWLIEAGEIWGNTLLAETWDKLEDIYTQTWDGYGIVRMGVDSGYRADEVYAFCRTHPRAFPTKGHDTLSKPFYASKIEVDARGAQIKYGLQLWHYDTDVAKSFVHGRIAAGGDVPNAWHVPDDVTDDYCSQVVAEERTVNPITQKVKWVKTGPNHFFDCEAGNYVMARSTRAVGRLIKAPVAQRAQAARPAPGTSPPRQAERAEAAAVTRPAAKARRGRRMRSKGISH
ncbi:MAG: terminase gpA endonuclease subunit, partial [Mycobacterium sp.]